MVRVLIAEDEWLISFALRQQLEKSGWEVVGIAKNGREAIDLCLQERPDLIFMDVRMPELDGIEATRSIMQLCPTCVVMLTAYGEDDHLERATKAGAMGYLVKPIGAEAILPAIERARARFQELQNRPPLP
jgi:response regulator NasT